MGPAAGMNRRCRPPRKAAPCSATLGPPLSAPGCQRPHPRAGNRNCACTSAQAAPCCTNSEVLVTKRGHTRSTGSDPAALARGSCQLCAARESPAPPRPAPRAPSSPPFAGTSDMTHLGQLLGHVPVSSQLRRGSGNRGSGAQAGPGSREQGAGRGRKWSRRQRTRTGSQGASAREEAGPACGIPPAAGQAQGGVMPAPAC